MIRLHDLARASWLIRGAALRSEMILSDQSVHRLAEGLVAQLAEDQLCLVWESSVIGPMEAEMGEPA